MGSHKKIGLHGDSLPIFWSRVVYYLICEFLTKTLPLFFNNYKHLIISKQKYSNEEKAEKKEKQWKSQTHRSPKLKNSEGPTSSINK